MNDTDEPGECAGQIPAFEPVHGLSDIDSGVNSDGSIIAETEPSVNLVDVDNVELKFSGSSMDDLILTNGLSQPNDNGVPEGQDLDMMDTSMTMD